MNPLPAISPDRLAAVGTRFQLPGEVIAGHPYGNGHINDTLLVAVQGGQAANIPFIFQRINHKIFRNIPALMENIRRVTEHLRARMNQLPAASRQRVLTLVPTRKDKPYLRDADGGYWRVYQFLEGTETVEEIEGPGQAYEAAQAFATFLGLLTDLPPPPLHETIPDFHHTPKRLATLEEAAAADPLGRRRDLAPELDFVRKRSQQSGALVDKLAAGELPLRTTHNDTKINNIRFDCATGRGSAVIDLDTVMPGLVHYDFGDMIRTAAFDGAEDDPDPDHLRLRPERLDAVRKGFLEGAADFLTGPEIDTLPLAGPLICLEIGARFLTDYLQGDLYFKTARPGHNLDRARVQFRRVSLLEEHGA